MGLVWVFWKEGVPNKAKFRKLGNTEPRGGPPAPQGPERKGSPQLIEPEDIVNFEGSRRRDDWNGQEYRRGVVRNGVRQEWASISDLSCHDSLSPQTGKSWESLDTSQHANSTIGLCRYINYQWTDRGKGWNYWQNEKQTLRGTEVHQSETKQYIVRKILIYTNNAEESIRNM